MQEWEHVSYSEMRTTYGHHDGLVVAGSGHGADTIDACGQSTFNVYAETTVAISDIIQALEEDEFVGLGGNWGLDIASQRLDSDMGVANDFAVFQLLWSGIVGVLGVGEGTGNQVVDLDINVEIGLWFQILAGFGGDDNGRDHV